MIGDRLAERVRELEMTLAGIGEHARRGARRVEEVRGDALTGQFLQHISEQCDEALASPTISDHHEGEVQQDAGDR